MPTGLLELAKIVIALRKKLAAGRQPAASSMGCMTAKTRPSVPSLQAHQPTADFRRCETALRRA